MVSLLEYANIHPPPKQRLLLSLVVEKLRIACPRPTLQSVSLDLGLSVATMLHFLELHTLTRAKGSRIDATKM